MVIQRTRVYQTNRQVQRGVMAGVSITRLVDVIAYVFNPDRDARLVLAIELTF